MFKSELKGQWKIGERREWQIASALSSLGMVEILSNYKIHGTLQKAKICKREISRISDKEN